MANGDITYTNPGAELVTSAFASGTYVGSGAAINVICGFQPKKIVLFNLTDDSMFVWVAGMAAGTFYQTVTGGTQSEVSSGGPVVYSGSSGEGFTIPATAVLNTAADSVVWEAWR